MIYVRQVVAYKNYFLDFYTKQTDSVQSKIECTLNLIRVTRQVPEKYFKHMEGTKGLYEIRIELESTSIEYFPSLTKEIWLFSEMPFKKKAKRHQKEKLKEQLK